MGTPGYSGTPLPKKLGIAEGSRVVVLTAPPDFLEKTLQPLPEGVQVRARLAKDLDVVLLFALRCQDIERRLDAIRASLTPAGGLWIAWPKRASKVPTEITEDVLREMLLPTGLVDNKVCAIDETWSGLRFVLRRELR
jgi:hypothetical protein